jgi:hypothetical protein
VTKRIAIESASIHEADPGGKTREIEGKVLIIRYVGRIIEEVSIDPIP